MEDSGKKREISRGRDGVIYYLDSKRVRKEFFTKEGFLKEIVVQKFSHPNIIRPLAIDRKKKTIDYPLRLPSKKVIIDDKKARKFLFQITHALCHIQKKGYLYLDVSVNNIMMDEDTLDFVLIDFGSVENLEKPENFFYQKELDVLAKRLLAYRAIPEMIKHYFFQPLFLVESLALIYDRKDSFFREIREYVRNNPMTAFSFYDYLRNCFEEKNYREIDELYAAKLLGKSVGLDVPTPEKLRLQYKNVYLV